MNNAYQTWDPAPAAFLILGDYPGSGLMDTGITAPVWNSYCVSDNIYADVDDDDMPDMIHARITARNADELQKMIGRMLEYERTPVTDAGFYDRPLIAGGWQTERWFILCCEIVLGHQANVLGKHPVREYAIYDGVPGSIWSSNPNTNMLVNYFGPNGLGYIPLTPQHLTDWSGNATRINNDLNAGSYFLLHRDHGEEIGWGEPRYTNSNLTGLHMGSKAPFVFSMNCLTGKYNWSSESFTEAFHRMAQGALGLVAASEISYSFVNDAYIFGLFDTMWPGFMPDYGPYPPETGFVTDLKPAFGMASGKYFLRSSNWPYNPGDKEVTYHLFHHHGDAFLTMNSEVPTAMAVTHDDVCLLGVGSLQIQAEAGAMIGLTVDGEIVGTAIATGFPQEVPIVPQEQPGELRVTVTKANRVRYDVSIPVIPPSGPYLVFDSCSVLDAAGDQDGEVDAGEATGLRLALENVGIEGTTGVSAVIASEDPLVEILTNENEFPNIPAGGIEHCSQPYRIHLLGTAPDQHTVGFTVTARANEGEWNGGFALRVQAPVLVPGNLVIDDSAPGGDGDGVVEPGETFFLQAWLSNTGHSDARSLIGMLSSTSPHVVIEDPEGASVRVPVGSNGLLSAFAIRVLPGCPSPAVVPLRIDVTNEAGFAATLAYEVQVGDWVDDVETDRGWALGAAGDNATTGQWVRVDPNGTTYNGQPAQAEDDHTAAGTLCFVTGQGSVGGAAGEADLDGGKTTLLTPVSDLGNAVSASIGYWRWYTNDLGNSPGLDWWDVDVTSDGTNWVHLEHTQASANSWNSYQFDLGAYVPLTSHVQLRFVAEDVSPGSLIEAAVDDFSLSATRSPVTGAEDSATIGRSEIVSLSPNPFNPRLSILFRSAHPGPVDLAIFDVGGRMVRSLVKGPVASGVHVAVFDGRDEAGRSLPSGIYFVRLDAADRMEVRQITLLK
ncbi:MAG: C25 family cysteine peptidase [Candidatus Eisenbacteria bacterium]|nr:C25 family cysteine peptidase [Candidatus Eisenbacteria bacterium]